jgi:hypothetical protein
MRRWITAPAAIGTLTQFGCDQARSAAEFPAGRSRFQMGSQTASSRREATPRHTVVTLRRPIARAPPARHRRPCGPLDDSELQAINRWLVVREPQQHPLTGRGEKLPFLEEVGMRGRIDRAWALLAELSKHACTGR